MELEECLAVEAGTRTEWDEPPALYFVTKDEAGYRLHDIEVPLVFWRLIPPPDVLEGLAHAIGCTGCAIHEGVRELPEALRPPPGWAGLAFRCEGWKVEMRPEDPPEVALGKEIDADARELHKREDKIENRMISAVLIDGTRGYATQDRGGPIETSAQHGITEVKGRVGRNLAALLLALLSRQEA